MRAARGVALCILMLLLLAGQALASQVSHHRFHSELLGRDYPYTLYLPEGYHDSGLDYPVLYLLHGSFGSDRDWVTRGALKEIADRMIRQGRIPPALIVMPGSQSWWVDGHNEPARSAHLDSYLAQDYVVPLYLSAGSRDVFDAVDHARRLQAALEENQPGQVPLEVLSGGHTWRVWRASLGPALTFMFRYLQPPRSVAE